ncbi:MAG TPA: SH3 domain-containing protein [Herpetosiphonaceae bacterium]
MPSKIDPNDWDRFFSASGPKHKGPLGTLISTIVVVGFIGALGWGGLKFKTFVDQGKLTAQANNTTVALTAGPRNTAIAQTAAAAKIPTPTANLPTARVLSQVNLRAEAGEGAAKKGELFPNDIVQVVEAKDVDGQGWISIRLVGDANAAQGAEAGATGWVIGSALSEPSAPPPVAQTEPTATAGPPPVPAVAVPAAQITAYRDQATGITLQRAPSWQPLVLGGIDNNILLAPSQESLEGAVAAKLARPSRDEQSLREAVTKVGQALGKPGTQPQIQASPLNAGGQLSGLSGTMTFVRSFNGQDVTIQAAFEARFISGAIGVVAAYVPQGSYAPNEQVLKQIANGAIFP